MVKSPTAALPAALATTFRRLGWVGFWVQTILSIIPVVLYVFGWIVFPKTELTLGRVLNPLVIAGLMCTVVWSYRYVRLGKLIQNSNRKLTRNAIIRVLWVGATVNILVIGLSVLVGMGVIVTLGVIMALNQRGLYQTTAGSLIATSRGVISPLDLIALQGVINAIAAGLVGIVVSLLLLRRID